MGKISNGLADGHPGVWFAVGIVLFVVLPLAVVLIRYDLTKWRGYGRHDAHNIEVKEPDWQPSRGQLPPPSFYVDQPIEDDLSTGRMFLDHLTPTERMPRVDPQPEPPVVSEEIPRQRVAGDRVAVHSGETPTFLECTAFHDQARSAA